MKTRPGAPRPTRAPAGRPAADALLGDAMRHHKAGRLREAEAGYRRVLAANPTSPDALHMLGVLGLQVGDPAGALPLLQRAVALETRNPEYLANLGSAHLMLGQREQGIAALERALSHNPSHVQARYNLGSARLEAGDLAAAKRELELAITLQPRYADAHNSLGIVLSQEDAFEGAERCFRKALELVPDHARALQNLGSVLIEMERFEEAVEQFQRLVRLEPDNPAAHFHLGFAHAKLKNHDQARAAYEQALALDPNYLDARNNLGSLLLRSDEPSGALDAFRAADRLRPNNPYILQNIAKSLQEMDRMAEAGDVYRRIIDLDQSNIGEAFAGLVVTLQQRGLFEEATQVIGEHAARNTNPLALIALKVVDRNYRPTEEEVGHIVEAVATADDPNSPRLAPLCFAAAGHFDRVGEYDRAFEYLLNANRIRNLEYDHDPDTYDTLVDRYRTTFTAELLEAKAKLGSKRERPIFIVGMPRSGTTLTEQIVASHPEVGGAGEQTEIGAIVRSLANTDEGSEDSLEAVTRLDGATIDALAERYLRHVGKLLPDYARTSDKMPGNFQHLGLIAILFSGASLVHCRRDPRDTCLSIFFSSFGGSHPYAYDLYKLGRRYRSYTRLMEHWHAVLPGRILDVVYEDLVNDQEAASHRLLEFCGLSWDDRVLQFHRTERTIKTASLWQVRQPIYRTSVERWRAYEKYLEPLERGLSGAPPAD
jgi:tetratricopeptide (TPR) repeat protein